MNEEVPEELSGRLSRMSNISVNSLFTRAALSQRIVSVEYYMAAPLKEFDNMYSDFRNSAVKKVPVIRIFGATSAGQKMCANIHGVYPYISVLDDVTIEGFEYKIASALDNAINDSVSSNKFKNQAGFKSTQHVFKILKVAGRTFYGYRYNSEVFLRIFFYNPLILKKAIDLLQSGSILGRRFQPYEAHIPYSLQFMIDYSLYGMNFVHYASAKFRRSSSKDSHQLNDLIPSSQGSTDSNSSLTSFVDPESLPENLLGPLELTKSTLCELEVDVMASDILLDTNSSGKAKSVNPGIDCIWKDEIERRRQQGVDNCSQITIPGSQERSMADQVHSTEDKYKQILFSKVHTFFDKTNASEDQSFVLETSQSILEDPTAFPSSQLHYHVSDEKSRNEADVGNQLSPEEDEFLKLLEDMAAKVDGEVDNKTAHTTINGLSEPPESLEEDGIVEEDLVDNEDDIWDDSFLSSSILEKISDLETSYKELLKTEEGESDKSSVIFQCDGQGDESDSSSDEQHSRKLRRSPRKSNKTEELQVSTSKTGNPVEQSRTSSRRNSTTVVESSANERRKSTRLSGQLTPGHRLSLTMRRNRKSRSQETKSSSSSVCIPTIRRRSLSRRSSSHGSIVTPVLASDARTKNTVTSSSNVNNQDKDLTSGKPKPVTSKTTSSTITSVAASISKKSNKVTTRKSRSEIANNEDSDKVSHTSHTSQKTADKVSPLSPEHKKVLQNKVARICLTKIDNDKLPTRIRRKPKRLLEEAETSSRGGTILKKDNVSSEQEGKTLEQSVKEESELKRVKRTLRRGNSRKQRKGDKTSVSEIEKQKSIEKTGESSSNDFINITSTTSTGEDGGRDVKRNVFGDSDFTTSITTNLNENLKSNLAKSKTHLHTRKGRSESKHFENVSDESYTSSNVSSSELLKSTTESTLKSDKELIVTRKDEVSKPPSAVPINIETDIRRRKNRKNRKLKKTESVLTMEDSQSNFPNISDSPIVTKIVASDAHSDNSRQAKRLGMRNRPTTKMVSTKGIVSSSVSSPAGPSNPINNNDQIHGSMQAVPAPEGGSDNDIIKQETDSHSHIDTDNEELVVETEPDLSKNKTIESKLTELNNTSKVREYVEVGTTCTPTVEVGISQTDKVSSNNISVQVQPTTSENSSQIQKDTQIGATQTLQVTVASISTQTDAVESLCLCQCTCVIKQKSDANTDNQDELKPAMENKRVQVDNVDLITRVRSARFTTPQGHKIKVFTTPSRSPEKRAYTESPKRRPIGSMMISTAHSRFLSALAQKTPTSTHKYRSGFRESPSTPEAGPSKDSKTPPSKEEYLMSVIRQTCSQKQRRSSVKIKPRNLHIEGREQEGNEEMETDKSDCVTTERDISSDLFDNENGNTVLVESTNDSANYEEVATEATDSSGCDMNINSIYEYDDDGISLNIPSPCPPISQSEATPAHCGESNSSNEANECTILTPQMDSPALLPSSPLSSFQKKRILSKNRSRIRLERRKAATLEANKDVPDVFDIEYDPLKQPPSYKSTMKWLEAEKQRCLIKVEHREENGIKEDSLNGHSSDEEEALPPVKLFGGGNMSDEDDNDRPSSGASATESRNRNEVKPYTPPLEFSQCRNGAEEGQSSQGSFSETPRSILRQSRCSSRRQSNVLLKRKIRWDDEEEGIVEPSKKRLRMGKFENGSVGLSNESILNKTADTSELDGPSFKNALGLENSMSNFQDVKAVHQCQFITTMCVEIHCVSRNGLTPDPSLDPILAIFVLVSSDYPDGFKRPRECLNIMLVENGSTGCVTVENGQCIKGYVSEIEMINAFIRLVRFWDPDMLVGFEVEKFSFGYLIQRGFHLGKDMAQELSRVIPEKKNGEKATFYRRNEEWNGTISGRIVLNLWRLLRHEITVQSYTFENAAYHILQRRVYKFSHSDLSAFWKQKMNRKKVIQYYTIRVKGVLQMMEKLDLVNRTSELARLFGIQFYEVLSRGSQFRVESMMLRATKPLDYVAPSPTVTQRAKMRAPEYLPLILEPHSNYYTDPVAVLDFQSLYPSMMIAYNYDYASLLGRVEHLGSMDRFPVGCLDHHVSPEEILRLRDHIHVSPAGVAFLNKSVVKGVVPEMLEQILDTRQMVKRAMKRWKNEGASLKKVLDSRQLGLKLIANVTYGYTSANFSGRMPCVEIADSIVSKGRETLQRAIDLVKANFHRWGGEVVYGDTDSMFILFRGKSREEAFKLGYEIAEEVTQTNPKPVKLKFEKIYQPCILQTKKRYVGYSYETPDQQTPLYDAKGIETVRRDGCPAVRKILEKTLHVLFTTGVSTKVENFVKIQFEKLFKGRVSMQDYIFAREYRGRQGYRPTACVPALEIAKKLTAVDPRAEPLVKERVPYVVIYGDPNLQLIRLVRRPEEYLQDASLRLNAHYYIEKVIIPALNRCLKLARMDASKWYLQMPRKFLRNVLEQKPGGQRTLDNYILHQNCYRCDGKAERGLCNKCRTDETATVIHLQEVVRRAREKLGSSNEICFNCAGETGRCVSIDCPILHKVTRYERDQPYIKNIEKELINLEW